MNYWEDPSFWSPFAQSMGLGVPAAAPGLPVRAELPAPAAPPPAAYTPWAAAALGIPQTAAPAPVNNAPAGSQFQYGLDQLQNGQFTDNNWSHFTGTDGTPLAAIRNYEMGAVDGNGDPMLGPLLNYNVFKDPGDFGGTGLGSSHESKMNGTKYDAVSPTGGLQGNGQFSGWTDAGIGDGLGVASIIAMALGGGALAGAGAGGAGAAEGLGVGAAGNAGVGAGYAGLDAAGAGTLGGGASIPFTGGTAAMGAGAAIPSSIGSFAPAATGSSGTGLSLGGGNLGLTGATGDGLTLAGGGGVGMTGASPGAATIGGGLGTGLAGGSGSLLSPSVLSGAGSVASGLASGAPAAAAPAADPAASSAGVPPPANPNATGFDMSSLGSSISSGISNGLGGYLGPLASLAGGLLGSQANTASKTQQLPAYLQSPVANDLIPRTQGLLNSQMPQAQTMGQQMMTQGSGLLGAPVAANGMGQVHLNSPTTATNPYLSGMADDISSRTQKLLGANNLAIQGNSVASGGMGGSRQGIAQGVAAGNAADSLQGQLANMYGAAYSGDQNRALQQYQGDQSFYTGQRGQDLAQVGIGSGLATQGLQTQWSPLSSAAGVYSPFTGFGTTTASQGGGLQGVLGGALGGAQLANNMGWLGNGNSSAGVPPPANPYATTAGWW